jgi:hypothetical protein
MGKSAVQKICKHLEKVRARLERQGLFPQYSSLDPNYPDSLVKEIEFASICEEMKKRRPAPEPTPPEPATEADIELLKDCPEANCRPPQPRYKLDISTEMLAEILGGKVSHNGLGSGLID